MYKLNTQLVMTDLWAAAAADKLGFEVEISVTYNGKTFTWEWEEYLSDNLYFTLLYPDDDCEIKVFITVTKSGPNAAERFLPQGGDTIADYDWRYLVDDILAEGSVGFISVSDAREKFSEYDEETHGRGAVRIIERDGIPFPQFSEVIEP